MSAVICGAPVAQLRWKLRSVMAERKISNAALGAAVGKHETTISRLRQKDTLPALGNDEIEVIRLQINKLSGEGYPECRMSDLVEVIEDD